MNYILKKIWEISLKVLRIFKRFYKKIMHQGYTDTLNALKKYRIL